jgi:hypothetical protein
VRPGRLDHRHAQGLYCALGPLVYVCVVWFLVVVFQPLGRRPSLSFHLRPPLFFDNNHAPRHTGMMSCMLRIHGILPGVVSGAVERRGVP